jgi:hypothetical protein
MAWTYQQIEREWLAGAVIDVPPDELIAHFERCERVFGVDWIRNIRRPDTLATLDLVAMGQRLASIDNVNDTTEFVQKLKKGDNSAKAELHAIHLLRSGGSASVELAPSVSVKGRSRRPDFRVRRRVDPWTYVEVTQTEKSRLQDLAEEIIEKLASIIFTGGPTDWMAEAIIAAATRA